MAQGYLEIKKINNFLRLPLEGTIDLTYRCNNNCRHCWLSIPSDSKEKKDELSLKEIKGIVDEAKSLGCRRWSISGGEPMLRPDFLEIFDYITSNSSTYSLNTNGTLITPKIAQLMKRPGTKMVALYGATRQVHDHITRNPGSFEATLAGFAYLKEAKAGFMVQLIPMKDNYHQFKDMEKLAQTLSKHYRTGAAWLYLSASGDQARNAEIIRQRLPPQEVVGLDQPDLAYEDQAQKQAEHNCCGNGSDYLFSACINTRRDFHIDPYGKMSFCCFVKDPNLRYDLRKGNFSQGWEKFIPSLATKIKIAEESKNNCGSCALRKDCRICPVYGYLEHRNFNAKVDYLCAVAKENKNFKENWQRNHRRYYRVADITLQVESDIPIKEGTFHSKLKQFEVSGPAEDMVLIRHQFFLPDFNGKDLGTEVYRKVPWAIYKKENSWIYLGISSDKDNQALHRAVVFNQDHTRARIYNDQEDTFKKGGLSSLTLFPTDQILLARILADKEGCYLHSCGVNFNGQGLLFAGHSEAGKSTMATMLKGKAEILCDDRVIIRRMPQGFKIYGTWSHGTVPDISAGSAPLKAIMFLEKAEVNELIALEDKKEITRRILACLIRPFVNVDWWEKTLLLTDRLVQTIPCYLLKFDKSGKIVDLLKKKLEL
ncbi:MAG: radical SAM protein [Candidatus Omnitrophica bacterium]|nr:radical SAM protein [Candidatus Omnitrophota bacterium]